MPELSQVEEGSVGHDHHGGVGHSHGATHGPLLWISLVVTLLFVLGEYIAGRAANSLALISDAGHNLSDALALGLAAYAIWIAQKPANARRTYGYYRVTILTALFNAVTLIVIGFFILVEAWHLLQKPETVNGTLMMWVAGIAVLMNTVIAYLLKAGAKESMNMRAAFVHMAGDALSALGVVVTGVIVRKTGWHNADAVVSVLIAGFILYSSWGILRDATDILLEGTPKDLDIEKLVAAIQRIPPVEAVHDLHIWAVSDGRNYLSCHVVVGEACTMPECTQFIRAINEMLFHDFGIAHATIQTELAGDCVGLLEPDPLFCGETAAAEQTDSKP